MANGPGIRTGTQRGVATLANVEAELRTFVKSPLASGSKAADVSGVLRGLRALGTLALSTARRDRLRARLLESIEKVMADMKLDARDLGARDHKHLAEMFVRMVERVGYERYNVSALRRKAQGLRGVFAGELFEQLVLNMRSLQNDLRIMARGQLENLLTLVADQLKNVAAGKRSAGRLIDCLGNPIPSSNLVGAKFKEIVRATDIFIYAGGKKLKFTDFAYVVVIDTPSGKPMVSFLVETEIKLPRAASDFSEQIGQAQGRFAFADHVELRIPGRADPVEFTPDQIIFDHGSINRTAVTMTRSSSDSYRFRETSKGGYDEVYTRVGLALDVNELRRLVNVLFRQ